MQKQKDTIKEDSVSTRKAGDAKPVQEMGSSRFEMHFLPDVYVPCEVCHGKRYNRENT